jgi:hypothetical protein
LGQDLLERNIGLNNQLIEAGGGTAVAFPLVWGSTDCSTLDQRWRHPGIVVAADVIYHRELISPLFEAMSSLGEPNLHQGKIYRPHEVSVIQRPCLTWYVTPEMSSLLLSFATDSFLLTV